MSFSSWWRKTFGGGVDEAKRARAARRARPLRDPSKISAEDEADIARAMRGERRHTTCRPLKQKGKVGQEIKALGYGGAIMFSNRSAYAIWCSEITGQISDGLWENLVEHLQPKTEALWARYATHYLYWLSLKPGVATVTGHKKIVHRGRDTYVDVYANYGVKAKSPPPVPKTAYRLADLMLLYKDREIRNRMIAAGRTVFGEYDADMLRADLRNIHDAMMTAWR